MEEIRTEDYTMPPPQIDLDEDIEEYIELEEKVNKEREDAEREECIISRLVIARENLRNALHDLRETVTPESCTNRVEQILNDLDNFIISNCNHNYINDVVEINDGGEGRDIHIRYCTKCYSADDNTETEEKS